MKKNIIYAVCLISVILLAGCATPHQQAGPYQQQGRVGGAVAGGTLGGVIGNNVGDGNNQVLGAAIGSALGAFIGDQYGQRQDFIDQRLDANYRAATQRVVSIRNTNGSYTDVTITRQHNAWIGPRGERYMSFPTSEQLHSIYGF